MSVNENQSWKSKNQRCRLGSQNGVQEHMGGSCHGMRKRVRKAQGCQRAVMRSFLRLEKCMGEHPEKTMPSLPLGEQGQE